MAYSPLGHGFFGGKGMVESLPSESLLVIAAYIFPLHCFCCQLMPLFLLLLLLLLLVVVFSDVASEVHRGQSRKEQSYIHPVRQFSS